jgi:hypothetical protein
MSTHAYTESQLVEQPAIGGPGAVGAAQAAPGAQLAAEGRGEVCSAARHRGRARLRATAGLHTGDLPPEVLRRLRACLRELPGAECGGVCPGSLSTAARGHGAILARVVCGGEDERREEGPPAVRRNQALGLATAAQNCDQRSWFVTSWWNCTSEALMRVPRALGQRSAWASLISAYLACTSSPITSCMNRLPLNSRMAS